MSAASVFDIILTVITIKQSARRRTVVDRDLTGQKVGDIRFLKCLSKNPMSVNSRWRCRCERNKADGSVCGKEFEPVLENVLRGATKSCGCLRREHTKKFWTKLELLLKYRYHNIIHRCYDPKNKYYCNYGGRGITVCDEWLHDKDAFIRYCVEHGARLDLEIDRIDNEGPYAPGNIRFVTKRENTLNRRCTVRVMFGVEEILLVDAAKRMGVEYRTVECWKRRGVLASRISDFMAGRRVFKHGGRPPVREA